MAPASRRPTPSPQPQPTTSRVTLEDWEQLAPLSELSKASVTAVQDGLRDRPFPPHARLSLAKPAFPNVPSRPQTPPGLRKKVGSRIDVASSADSVTDSPRLGNSMMLRPAGEKAGPLELTTPVETTQQFYDWYARVENAMEREQEEAYRACLAEVEAYVAACDEVVEQLEDARGLIHEMDANYRFVEENSRALQVACEQLLEEQKHLLQVSTAITSRLDYFRQLDSATRMLNLPGEDIVLKDDFVNLLGRLDECLDFLRHHRTFKDSEIYLIRFQQCLTRSMTLIKMFFMRNITALGSEVVEKALGKELQEAAQHTLFYTKFEAASETLQPLILELEKRSRADPQEYGSLMAECYSCWFAVRNQLLTPPLAEEVKRMNPQTSDLIKLARAGCNHLRTICFAEWDLFRAIFPVAGEEHIYHYLESLCDHLYDSLRPRVLHEPKLEVLCELCTVLQALMALDADNETEDDEIVDEASSPFGRSSKPTIRRRLRFSTLLETILQDAQTRLVFRAQSIVQSEVLKYSPTEGDLDYPEKLKDAKRLSTLFPRLQDGDGAGSSVHTLHFELPSDQAQASWYPTLRRTLWVLSKLHTFVKSTIFEDFAGEAVTLCRQSLSIAAQEIAKKPTASRLDGQLFLIRHLLILKEMVRSFDLVQIDRALDLSSVTDMLTHLLRNSTAFFNPNALFELASRGLHNLSTETTMTDAKHDLDAALKTICEDLIAQSALSVTLPLRSFLGRAATHLSSTAAATSIAVPAASTSSPGSLSAQEWASAEEIKRLHDAFVAEGGGLEQGVRDIVDKLSVWLSDRATIGVLVPPMQDEIADTYTSFHSLVRSEYDEQTSGALLSPASVRDRLRALAGAVGGSVKS